MGKYFNISNLYKESWEVWRHIGDELTRHVSDKSWSLFGLVGLEAEVCKGLAAIFILFIELCRS